LLILKFFIFFIKTDIYQELKDILNNREKNGNRFKKNAEINARSGGEVSNPPPYKPKGKTAKIHLPPMFPQFESSVIESLSSSSSKNRKRKTCEPTDFNHDDALKEIAQFADSSYYANLNELIAVPNKTKKNICGGASVNYNSED
jgi:hypothetical protein